MGTGGAGGATEGGYSGRITRWPAPYGCAAVTAAVPATCGSTFTQSPGARSRQVTAYDDGAGHGEISAKEPMFPSRSPEGSAGGRLVCPAKIRARIGQQGGDKK